MSTCPLKKGGTDNNEFNHSHIEILQFLMNFLLSRLLGLVYGTVLKYFLNINNNISEI